MNCTCNHYSPKHITSYHFKNFSRGDGSHSMVVCDNCGRTPPGEHPGLYDSEALREIGASETWEEVIGKAEGIHPEHVHINQSNAEAVVIVDGKAWPIVPNSLKFTAGIEAPTLFDELIQENASLWWLSNLLRKQWRETLKTLETGGSISTGNGVDNSHLSGFKEAQYNGVKFLVSNDVDVYFDGDIVPDRMPGVDMETIQENLELADLKLRYPELSFSISRNADGTKNLHIDNFDPYVVMPAQVHAVNINCLFNFEEDEVGVFPTVELDVSDVEFTHCGGFPDVEFLGYDLGSDDRCTEVIIEIDKSGLARVLDIGVAWEVTKALPLDITLERDSWQQVARKMMDRYEAQYDNEEDTTRQRRGAEHRMRAMEAFIFESGANGYNCDHADQSAPLGKYKKVCHHCGKLDPQIKDPWRVTAKKMLDNIIAEERSLTEIGQYESSAQIIILEELLSIQGDNV